MCTKFVAYYRVSTDKQGKSGLGLEAQEAAVVAFIASKGEDARLLASFVEIESGKRSDNRPQLKLAMEQARLTGATLLIAKMDRLSRDAHFLLGLQKAGVKFVAADMPEANELVVGIMAMIAQAERQMISARTKAALAAAKARGVKLGNPRGAAHLRGRQSCWRGRSQARGDDAGRGTTGDNRGDQGRGRRKRQWNCGAPQRARDRNASRRALVSAHSLGRSGASRMRRRAHLIERGKPPAAKSISAAPTYGA